MPISQSHSSIKPTRRSPESGTLPFSDVQWSRPVFKAPPLKVEPPIADIRDFIAIHPERMVAR